MYWTWLQYLYLLQNHLHSSLVIILILPSTTTPKVHPATHTYNTHSHKYMCTHIFVIINFYNGCSFYFQNFPFILLHSPILDKFPSSRLFRSLQILILSPNISLLSCYLHIWWSWALTLHPRHWQKSWAGQDEGQSLQAVGSPCPQDWCWSIHWHTCRHLSTRYKTSPSYLHQPSFLTLFYKDILEDFEKWLVES